MSLDAIRRLQESQKAEKHDENEVFGWDMAEVPDVKPRGFKAKRDAMQAKAKGANIDAQQAQGDDRQAEHDALMQECDRVSLLEIVREYTGESGKRNGNRYDFTLNPITDTHDDLSVYDDTNSFASYTEQLSAYRKNGKKYAGGNVLDFLELYHLHHGGGKTEAVKELHERSGCAFDPSRPSRAKPENAIDRDSGGDDGASAENDGFPPITPSMVIDTPKRAPVLIDGILREGHTLLVTARSKAGKTFLMLQLCVAVACGSKWLGKKCKQGRVLFVNPEVDPPSAENRLHDVAEAMNASLETVQSNVDFWHLRGHVQGIEDTARALRARVSRGEYKLIIFDSVYELYTGDENSADDARKFFHIIDRVSKNLDCAVAMTHHHAKGIRADLDALDRGSGSGVFGRKPDAPLDMIQVFPPNDDGATLEQGVTVWRVSDSGLREFVGIDPFNVFFKYPRHIVDYENVTAGWKPRSGQQSGGKKTGEKNKQKSEDRAQSCVTALLAEFVKRGKADGIPAKEAAEIVSAAIGETVKAQTLKTYVEKSEQLDVDQVSAKRWQVTPKETPPPSLDV